MPVEFLSTHAALYEASLSSFNFFNIAITPKPITTKKLAMYMSYMSCPPMSFSITNAVVVTPEAVLDSASIRVEDGRIIDLMERTGPHTGTDVYNARGALLLPGLVDIHADSLEAAIAPRPAAPFDPDFVLPAYDAHLAACGYTTVFHCVGLADLGDAAKPMRTREKAASILAALRDFSSQATVRTRIHLRYEVTDIDSLPLLEQWVCENKADMLSLMDHTPGHGVFEDVAAFRRYAARSGQSFAASDTMLLELAKRRDLVDAQALHNLVSQCHRQGLTVVSHDDHSVEKLDWALQLGIFVAEFPVTMQAVDYARSRGMQTVFGSPNFIRGHSHAGNLSVRELVQAGKADILCLDYAPMCSLPALLQMARLGPEKSLAAAARLLSLNPAQSVGMDKETGSIEKGKAADCILVDASGAMPKVLATFVNGQAVYLSGQQLCPHRYHAPASCC